MEMNQRSSSSSNMKKNPIEEHVIGVPISSASAANPAERSPKGLLPDPASASQYHIPPPDPSNQSPKFRHSKVDSVIGRMNKLGEKVDNFAQSIREHVRLGPKITETVMGKLSLGARILQVGGVEKVFNQFFSVRQGEKLLKASQRYLSTTAGPMAGLLFISTDKIAFCSERSIKLSSPTGQSVRIHYKVLIPLQKIKRAKESENVKKPSQKYLEIVTMDGCEFWFMGFLDHRRTFKYLQKAVSRAQ